MSVDTIITLVLAVVSIIGILVTIITSARSGSLKEFILEKMEEAEEKFSKPEEKLNYVLEEVKKEYKLLSLIVDIKLVIETLIKFSKKVNYKK